MPQTVEISFVNHNKLAPKAIGKRYESLRMEILKVEIICDA